MRRRRHPRPRLCHARRARDGQPLRGDVGPVPLHPVDRDRRRLRARRVLLAQQGRPQLFAVPRHQGPRAGCGTPRQIRAERQGLDGDHETVLHSGRGTVRQADHRFLRRRGAEIQLLAVLAHHVRVRELAFRAGNETVHQTVHPPHRRSAGLQRVAVHPIQPVRVDDPADGEVPRSARRAVPLQHQGRERRVCDRRRERTRTRAHRGRTGHDPEDPGHVRLLQAQPVRHEHEETRRPHRHRPRR